MKNTNRNVSVISEKSNLEHLYTYKKFPVFIGATNQPKSKDVFCDLSIFICRDTGMIQLGEILPLDEVYSEYHSEALGSIWKLHHNKFSSFINQFQLKNILEIGGGNGEIAKESIRHDKKIQWTIIEPNPSTFNHPQIKICNTFFDKNFSYMQKVDGVIHSHTFEHMYKPREFLHTISQLLTLNQYHIFSVPNLYQYLINGYTNILNFEHTIFLTEYFIDYLLSEYNFKIVQKKYFNNHSIFYATQKTCTKPYFNFQSKYGEYKTIYLDYVKKNEQFIKKLNQKVKAFQGDCYLFGAHVFSQYLLNRGMKTDKLQGIIDNSTIKQGKRLYGTPYSIFSPIILKNINKASVILRAGAYQDEIKTQLLRINPKITIFE